MLKNNTNFLILWIFCCISFINAEIRSCIKHSHIMDTKKNLYPLEYFSNSSLFFCELFLLLKILILKFDQQINLHFLSILDHYQAIKKIVESSPGIKSNPYRIVPRLVRGWGCFVPRRGREDRARPPPPRSGSWWSG